MSKKGFFTGIIALACGLTSMTAQVTIGADKTPETFSVLELISNNKHGLRLPHLTTQQRNDITTPEFKANSLAEGLTIFNIDTKCWETWNGAEWITLCAPNTVSLPFTTGTDNQTVCKDAAIIGIVYTTTGATGATFSGLPAGVTGNWTNNTVTISGTPTEVGTFNYAVTLTGGTGKITATGTITVTAPVTPSVTIAAVPSGAICAGTSVTFTPTPTNGGAAPTYEWFVNSVSKGVSATYTTTALANGETVTCKMTSNATCASPTTATSDGIIMTVISAPAQPSTITGNNNVCTSATGLVYYVTDVPGVTFTWAFPAGWNITAGQGTNSVTVDAPSTAAAAANITVTPKDAVCGTAGPQRTYSVTVTAFSQPNPTSPIKACPTVAITITLAASTPAGTYLWESSSDGINWVAAPTPNNTANYTIPANTLSSDMYYRRKATAACGTIISTAVFVDIPNYTPEFYPINLGADPQYDTPKKQMEYLASPAYSSLTAAQKEQDATVYGDLYQWGRSGKGADNGYQLRTSNFIYADNITSGAITYDAITGQINHPYFLGKFVYGPSPNYDWRMPAASTPASCTSTSGGKCDNLWGNGVAINITTPGGGQPGTGTNSDKTYQQGVKTGNDPCPDGWRVPTQDEWEMLGNYCDAAAPANDAGNLGFWRTTTGYTWVAVQCSGGQAIVRRDNWTADTPGGYAVYRTSDWNALTALGVTTYTDLLSNPAYTKDIVLFLPAAGFRNASIQGVGLRGIYTTSSISNSNAALAMGMLHIGNSGSSVNMGGGLIRSDGASVRCVKEKVYQW